MSALLGFLLWGLLFYPVWSPRMRRVRRQMREAVSRNPTYDELFVAMPWEQDSVWPEVFEEEA